MSENKERSKEIIAEVIEKARQDESFKQELIANPIAAINEFTGKDYKFPEGKVLVFVDQDKTPENTDSTYYFNIATYGDLEEMELTEEQLESIAGGTEDILPPFPWPILIPTF